MKTTFIRRHFRGPYSESAVTIVGEITKDKDGTHTLKFGAARCSPKDHFIRRVGMDIATERYESSPCTIKLYDSYYLGVEGVELRKLNNRIERFANYLANSPEFFNAHFANN